MRPQRSTSRWAAAFGGAAVVNALVIVQLARAPAPPSTASIAPSSASIASSVPIEVELLTPARGAAPARPPPPPHPMQVVETAKPAVETPPDHARFASEHDTKVDRETIARGTAPEPAPALVRPMGSHAPGVLAMREPSTLQVPDAPAKSPARGIAPGTAPDLRPSPELLRRVAGAGSVDHVENVVDGDATALNSVRWVYASFFNRVKDQVAQAWDPVSVWRRDDPTGHVYGGKTRVTELRVSLTATGAIAKIAIVSPSGVGDLDDEAVRAFQVAGPFPNPPKELAGRDGLITFGFTFFFEIDHSGTAWHL